MNEEQKVIEHIVGLDLGQSTDYTAITFLERSRQKTGELDRELRPKFAPPAYLVRYLERLKLGTPYPQQVARVKELVSHSTLQGKVTLALDFTGVGRPVADMFREAKLPCSLYCVSIHGGNSITWDGSLVSVPKRDLVAAVQVLLQSGRLKILESLPETKTLVRELLNFKVKIDPVTSHDSYAAWREGIHDDMVLATALACWIAEHRKIAGVW